MIRRHRLVPPRLRPVSVRRLAGVRSQRCTALSWALLPTLAGLRRPASRLVTPPVPLPEPPLRPELLAASP